MIESSVLDLLSVPNAMPAMGVEVIELAKINVLDAALVPVAMSEMVAMGKSGTAHGQLIEHDWSEFNLFGKTTPGMALSSGDLSAIERSSSVHSSPELSKPGNC